MSKGGVAHALACACQTTPRLFLSTLMLRLLSVAPAARAGALVAMLWLGAAPAPLSAQGAPMTRSAHLAHSAPITNISYEVTIDSETAAARSLAVAMHFRVAGPGPVVLALPAWTPGHYTLLWFSRRISSFTPTSAGGPRRMDPVGLSDMATRRAQTGLDGNRCVRLPRGYQRPGGCLDAARLRVLQRDQLFMYPVGQGFNWPAEVDCPYPEQLAHRDGNDGGCRASHWRMHDYNVAHVFTASNYHDLVDMPFFVGNFDIDSIAVSAVAGGPRTIGYERRIIRPGLITGQRMTRWLKWLARIAPTHAAVFHDMPWSTYTVLQVTDPHPNGGGLEHQDSQLDEISPDWVDLPLLPGLDAHADVSCLEREALASRRYGAVPVRRRTADRMAVGIRGRDGLLRRAGYRAQWHCGFDRILRIDGECDDVGRGGAGTAVTDALLRPWIDPTEGRKDCITPKARTSGFMLDILIRGCE